MALTMRKLLLLAILPIFTLLAVTDGFGGEEEPFTALRHEMVDRQIRVRGVKDPGVLGAVEKVPRHLFVPAPLRFAAYGDYPLPIGEGQTISQPYIVAFMTEALRLKPDDKVLEIGTGSGYQAAILAELVREVYTIEIVEELGKRAQGLLEQMGYRNIHVRIGDGYKGWPEDAPFDAIMVTAAPDEIPEQLVSQLKEGGRLVLPVGKPGTIQELILGTKVGGRLKTETLMAVRFVPMVKER
jgi:protein-L-isoaspartate(D-aspartate) O-methyltransferase